MEYRGKLYGKFGKKHFDTGKTSEDFDELLEALQIVKIEIENVDLDRKRAILYTVNNAINKALKK